MQNSAAKSVSHQRGSNESLGIAELQKVYTGMQGEILRLMRRRTGNPETAADLTQDVFIKLSSIRVGLPDERQARAYLFRMASNLAIDHVRTESRRADLLSGTEVLFEDAEVGPDETAILRDQVRVVEEALTELPAKCRDVLFMSRQLGMMHKEIADELGVSVSLVEKYQLRALRHCRERLGNMFS